MSSTFRFRHLLCWFIDVCSGTVLVNIVVISKMLKWANSAVIDPRVDWTIIEVYKIYYISAIKRLSSLLIVFLFNHIFHPCSWLLLSLFPNSSLQTVVRCTFLQLFDWFRDGKDIWCEKSTTISEDSSLEDVWGTSLTWSNLQNRPVINNSEN